jgi:hypothetical protein
MGAIPSRERPLDPISFETDTENAIAFKGWEIEIRSWDKAAPKILPACCSPAEGSSLDWQESARPGAIVEGLFR